MFTHSFIQIAQSKARLGSGCRLTLLAGLGLALGLSAQADTVTVTYVGADTGVNNGADYVLPYQLTVNGIPTDATCYDVFDDVTANQTWTANELTLGQAATGGQFSSDPDALADYKEIGFLSQQTTSSAQNQIDLQEDIWNVFAPGRYSVTTGMQDYLDTLSTPALTSFDFNSVLFLEDADQTDPGRAQAFVIDPPSATPEPGTIVLLGGGLSMVVMGSLRKRMKPAASV